MAIMATIIEILSLLGEIGTHGEVVSHTKEKVCKQMGARERFDAAEHFE